MVQVALGPDASGEKVSGSVLRPHPQLEEGNSTKMSVCPSARISHYLFSLLNAFFEEMHSCAQESCGCRDRLVEQVLEQSGAPCE